MQTGFQDRHDAGQQLASVLQKFSDNDELLVLALPRGGVPVAMEVARVLHAPLDLWLVRKLGVPGNRELAMGAIAFGGVVHLNEEEIVGFGIGQAAIDQAIQQESEHLEQLNQRYRNGAAPPDVTHRTVIVIDDGIATGATMQAAVASLRKAGARRIIVATPVGSLQSCAALFHDADDVVCLLTPEPFFAVGQWYEDFRPTSDAEVVAALQAFAS